MTLKDTNGLDLVTEFEMVSEELKYCYPSIYFDQDDINEIHIIDNKWRKEPDTLFSILLYIKLLIRDIFLQDYGESVFKAYKKATGEIDIMLSSEGNLEPKEFLVLLGLYPEDEMRMHYAHQLSQVAPPILEHIRKEMSGDSDSLFQDIRPYLDFTKMFKPHVNEFLVKLTARIMELSVNVRL